MAPSPQSTRLLAMIEDIKTAMEKDDAKNAVSRPGLLDKISKLRDAVETPQDSILRIYSQPMQNAALRVAVELGLLETISGVEPGTDVSLDHLAEMGRSDPHLLSRLMRVITAMGICTEVGSERYTSNALNEVLVQPGYTAGVKFLFDVEIPTMAKLVECLDKIEYKNPENVLQCPFDYAFGASLFDWLKAHPSSSHRYNAYMAGRRRGKASWIEHYPIRERLIDGANTGESVFIVDVAGNQGHDLDLLWDTYHKSGIPGRMILQDVVEKREAGSPASYEHMHYDFFTPQPIKGARVYHLRAILHDYPASVCHDILSHIAEAMTPNYSKLIIREFILPDTNVPLLTACNDMRMMMLHAGLERTEGQFRELLSGVGLEMVGIWTMDRGGEGVIEAVKKDGETS